MTEVISIRKCMGGKKLQSVFYNKVFLSFLSTMFFSLNGDRLLLHGVGIKTFIKCPEVFATSSFKRFLPSFVAAL